MTVWVTSARLMPAPPHSSSASRTSSATRPATLEARDRTVDRPMIWPLRSASAPRRYCCPMSRPSTYPASGLTSYSSAERPGTPVRSALLYEVRPDAGYVLGLDIGQQYLRGALADLSGQIIGRSTVRSRASSVAGRVAELVRLADELCGGAGISRADVTQTVIGSPGVYD